MLTIAVLISGYGSNLQAIMDAIKKNRWPIKIACVISDQPEAYGLKRAEKASIPAYVFQKKDFPDKDAFEQAMVNQLKQHQVEWVVLAGFMRILGNTFLSAFPERILNIHPSLLPKYPGLNTHERVIANGDKEHGVTVHLVTAELDGGPILAQKRFPVSKSDTPETLKSKIHHVEHSLYPAILHQIAQHKK